MKVHPHSLVCLYIYNIKISLLLFLTLAGYTLWLTTPEPDIQADLSIGTANNSWTCWKHASESESEGLKQVVTQH